MTDHTCLACRSIHPDAREVTLHDGRVVSSYSEDWRHEAEAISVVRMATKNERLTFISLVDKHRGKPAAEALRASVAKLWDLRLANFRAVG